MKSAIVVCLMLLQLSCWAQNSSTGQFWNEYAFNRDISKKWTLEVNFGDTWTASPDNKNIFAYLSQIYGRAWVHHYVSDRWKLSAFYAYYYNPYVTEISQRKAPEWRSAVQATYYIHKGDYTINTRFRIEDRHIKNPDSVYEAVQRFRGQIRLIYPIGKPAVTAKTFYALMADELFFKTASKISGPDFFDRNRLTVGLGYLFTNNLQLEVSYANEWKKSTEFYNALQVNVTINNFLPRLINAVSSHRKYPEGGNDQ